MEFFNTYDELSHADRFFIENGIIKGMEVPIFSSYENLGEMIWDNLSESPEHVAQIDAITGKKKTFKDLKDRSIRLALWMKKKGIKPGDIITLCSPAHSDVDVIIFATLFVGAIYNAFPCEIDLMLARRFIKQMEPRIIFVCKDNLLALQKAAEIENHKCEIIVLDNEDDGDQSFNNILKASPADEMENFQVTKDISRESLCILAPTSGSTGIPKFVSHSHAKILYRLPQKNTNSHASNETNITLLRLLPEWEIHFTCVLVTLLLKSTRIFYSVSNPVEMARIIEKYKVNHSVMSTYRALSFYLADEASKYNLDSVLTITATGGVLPTKAMKKINKLFPNAFLHKVLGSSETTGLTRSTEKNLNPESQGTVVPNVHLKFVDVITGKTLGANEVGEMCVKSPFIMSGYYKNPVDTARLYDDEGWLHTGDEAYYDENGEIVITGRLKDRIKSARFEIQPSLVEQMLMSHPDITDAGVVGIPDDSLLEKPVACIKKLPGSKITEQDVQKLINELECGHLFESSIIFLDEIPRTPNGKINKRILRERVEKIFKSKQPESATFEA